MSQSGIMSRRRREASLTESEHGAQVHVEASPAKNEDEEELTGSEYTDDSGEETDEGEVEGERNPADGESPQEDQLDDDEDAKNPAFIPRKGAFYEHDSRSSTDVTETEQEAAKEEERPRKPLWKEKERWAHDCFDERDQAPKSREELIALYGHDIRTKDSPPAEPPRAYSRGRGGRGRGRGDTFLGDFVNSSRSFRGQRGSRGRRGQRGGGRGYITRGDNRNSAPRLQQEDQRGYITTGDNRNLAPRSQQENQSHDIEVQEMTSQQSKQHGVTSQDVRSQGVRSQDVRSQDVRYQDESADPTPGEAFNRQSSPTKPRDAPRDQISANKGINKQSAANLNQSDQQNGAPTANRSQEHPVERTTTLPVQQGAPPAGREETGKRKRYSLQRQNVGQSNPPPPPPAGYMQQQQQPVGQPQPMRYTGPAPNAPPVVSHQMFVQPVQPVSSVQLMAPSSFMAGAPPPIMAGVHPPRQPMQGTPPRQTLVPAHAGLGVSPQMAGASPLLGPVAPNMMQSAGAPIMSYPRANMPNPGIPVQGMLNPIIPSQAMPGTGIPNQGIPVPAQQFAPMPRMPPPQQGQPSTTPGSAEPGVQIGGAVYYQSPSQRPPIDVLGFYPTPPPSGGHESSGTTFYPQPHQAPATPPAAPYFNASPAATNLVEPSGTTYYATPPAATNPVEPSGTTYYATPPAPSAATEKAGPVYYNTKSQSVKGGGQQRPRVKNVIPIVKPSAEDVRSGEEKTVDSQSIDPEDEASEVSGVDTTSQPIQEQQAVTSEVSGVDTTSQPIQEQQAVTSKQPITETVPSKQQNIENVEIKNTERNNPVIHVETEPISDAPPSMQDIPDQLVTTNTESKRSPDRPITMNITSEGSPDQPITMNITSEGSPDQPITMNTTSEGSPDRPMTMNTTSEGSPDRPITMNTTSEGSPDRPITMNTTSEGSPDRPITMNTTSEGSPDRPITMNTTSEGSPDRPITMNTTSEGSPDRPITMNTTSEGSPDRPITMNTTSEGSPDRPTMEEVTKSPHKQITEPDTSEQPITNTATDASLLSEQSAVATSNLLSRIRDGSTRVVSSDCQSINSLDLSESASGETIAKLAVPYEANTAVSEIVSGTKGSMTDETDTREDVTEGTHIHTREDVTEDTESRKVMTDDVHTRLDMTKHTHMKEDVAEDTESREVVTDDAHTREGVTEDTESREDITETEASTYDDVENPATEEFVDAVDTFDTSETLKMDSKEVKTNTHEVKVDVSVDRSEVKVDAPVDTSEVKVDAAGDSEAKVNTAGDSEVKVDIVSGLEMKVNAAGDSEVKASLDNNKVTPNTSNDTEV